MALDVTHLQNKTALTDIYQRSPAIWGNCPLGYIKKHYPEGYVRWDASRMELTDGVQDTETRGPIPGTKVHASLALKVTGLSAVNSVEKWGGVIRFGSDTDNDASSLAQAFPTFRMSGDPETDSALFFEGCVAVSSLATDTLGFFMGMAETDLLTLSETVPLSATDTPSSAGSMIGFHKGEAALGVVDTVRADRASTYTNIGASAVTISAANTFIKLGMYYNPKDKDRCVRFYADNIELTSALTRANVTAFTNIDANALGPIFATITATSGTATLAFLKWLEVAQLPPGVSP